MSDVIHNKLVRDKIPEIIRKDNHMPVMRVLTDAEKLPAALAKTKEEVQELEESNGDLGEIVDVIDTAMAVASAKGFTEDEVMQARREKTAKRGGFSDWIFLEKVIGKK